MLPSRAAVPALQEPAVVEREVALMGTWLRLEVQGATRAAALEASEVAVRAVEACEARLSTWRDDSELARLNRCPVGQVFELSPATARDLARARELRAATGGAFEPGIGGMVRAWGLRTGGRRPAPAELEALVELHGLDALELTGRGARRLDARLEIEEGGFGKGVALDEALAALASRGSAAACLDLGGQIARLGVGTARVRLADPRDRGRAVLELALGAGSLATSGNSEHGISVEGEHFGHVLDPRTGHPAPDFGSLSVIAPDATSADALSTGLYVLGPEAALAWADAHPPFACLVLEIRPEGLRARASAAFPRELLALVPDLQLANPAPPSASKTGCPTPRKDP
jgi:thiamine biosynthesis lipoprotein